MILNEAGKVLDANPEYVRLTGHRDLSENRARSVVEWTADYEREKNAAAIRQCVHDGFTRNFEIDYTDSADHITPIEINATVVHENGKSRIITLCREIRPGARYWQHCARARSGTGYWPRTLPIRSTSLIPGDIHGTSTNVQR